MMEYLRQKQTIATPFANRSYQSRSKATPVRSQAITTQLRPKATPVKRCKTASLTRPHKDKLSKPRKVNVGFHPEFMQRNWPATVREKEMEAVKQAPAPAQPVEASVAQSPTLR